MFTDALIVLGGYDTDEDILSSGDGAITEDVPQVALSEEVSPDKTSERFDVVFLSHWKVELILDVCHMTLSLSLKDMGLSAEAAWIRRKTVNKTFIIAVNTSKKWLTG